MRPSDERGSTENSWPNVRAVLTILANKRSLTTALAVAAFVFVFAVWLPNLRLLFIVWTDASISLGDKVALPVSLLPSIRTNFTLLSAAYTITIAILTGINVALMLHLIRMGRSMIGSSAAAGVSGIFTGALGLGCAACGSLILTSLISTVGGISVLALPLRGGEFGFIGVALLIYSTYLLAKQITKPLVCEPEPLKP
ncbi:hypothetical protein A3A38_03740 [Candidatus Kaiserbacteria bacterium RIFCSPLOWO2_01_FULL_53_17]|uniref:Uncharacterized protein n=1 Tax=Candidatus Kaiserbacteria bacterium RIFCSPLOWO2_01_FULL_53_17 TaxID=1798511 RepID=A0A1F6EGH5_9BACT|nr:MAG: hypothetical protein A3A38_03740 [Candidatus Kaiserbacteria bacterium RIFCSPLOWO2_01_FULL_53_17]